MHKATKTDQKQMLLLLDGHSTHTKNLEAILMAREYGIIMLSFPAHTTHRLQPLDRSFFKSLKSSYNEVASSWLRSNPGCCIKQANVAELLGKAYPRAVRMNIALNRFKATGLWPCDRYVIKEEDFVATSVNISDPSQQEIDKTTESTTETSSPSILMSPIAASLPITVAPSPIVQSTSPPKIMTTPLATGDSTPPIVQPGPSIISRDSSHNEDILTVNKVTQSHLNILSPVPCIKKVTKGTKPTMEISSSPYKSEIEVKVNINKKACTRFEKY